MSLTTRLLAAGAAGLALAGALVAPAPATAGPKAIPAAASGTPARTSAAERRRVDAVRTPKLNWFSCYSWGQCATAKVPLDYDQPNGKQVTLALLSWPASIRKKRSR